MSSIRGETFHSEATACNAALSMILNSADTSTARCCNAPSFARTLTLQWDLIETVTCRQAVSVPLHSTPFHSITFHPIPFQSIPVHSILFQSIPVHSIPAQSIPVQSSSVHSFIYSFIHSFQRVRRLHASGTGAPAPASHPSGVAVQQTLLCYDPHEADDLHVVMISVKPCTASVV